MKKINVKIMAEKNRNYEVLIGKGILKKLKPFLKKQKYDKIGIITDSNIEKLFLKKMMHELKPFDIESFIVPAGEKSKSIECFAAIQEKLIERNFSRKSAIIAFGGGMIGDLAGFCSATFMRGIDLIQVPTTLLAAVDSGVGGKTAINSGKTKNMIGVFYQPKIVLIETKFLQTLPRKEFNSGMGEVIKYGIIMDKKLFAFLKNNSKKIISRNSEIMGKTISECIKIKAKVVSEDEKESNKRKILNFGHTFGHAIEADSKFKLTHGESIAIGMIFESMLGEKINVLKKGETKKIKELIADLGLKAKFKSKGKEKKLIDLMKHDKKNFGGKIVFSLPKKIGEMKKEKGKHGITVSERKIRETLGEFN
ncbi:MAG: 3-dehydroquinate synthase [Candidatus Diapherotrites archaeon]